MPSRESCLRAWRKLDKCDLPKPVCRARSETVRVPRCILRSNSTRSRSCIWVKFISGKSASSHVDGRSQFSFSKPICAFWASFSRFLCTSNRTNEELCLAALTQKIQLSTLGLLQLAQVVGNSRGCGSFAQSNEGCSLVCLQLSPLADIGEACSRGFARQFAICLNPTCRAIPDSARST